MRRSTRASVNRVDQLLYGVLAIEGLDTKVYERISQASDINMEVKKRLS
jgi:hypothetical protein